MSYKRVMAKARKRDGLPLSGGGGGGHQGSGDEAGGGGGGGAGARERGNPSECAPSPTVLYHPHT